MENDILYSREYLESHTENGRDITTLSWDELYRMAYFETITGHHNWNYMWTKLDYRYMDPDFRYCFVHFDIKDFKLYNEMFDHDIANDLLRNVCKQMEAEKDWIYHSAKCHNDNFAMMVKAMPDDELVEKLYEFFDKISALPADPSVKVYYRCGAVTMEDATSKGHQVADLAKFAQRLGVKSNCTEVYLYTSDMYEKMMERKRYLSYLDKAIENDEFLIHLQPKYDSKTQQIVGAEALVRWNYKHEKMLYPVAFVPGFEESGVIGKVDQVVFEKTCQLLKDMQEEGLPLLPISVNLSRRRMENKNLLKQLVDCVDAYGIPHGMVEFELTEGAAYANQEEMFQLLENLKNKDFCISIDDFGTGYSSMSMLLKMPMDTLKIDKCFVDCIDAEHDTTRECIVISSIIRMAKDLGLCCLAEGVETKEQLDYLKDLGCDRIQGYYFSKPVSCEEYVEKIREQCRP